MENLPWPAQLGAATLGWALAGMFFVLVYRGKLRPESAFKELIESHARELEDISHDRGEWRTAHRISETARLEAVGQVHELLEHARTTDAFIRSLPTPRREVT